MAKELTIAQRDALLMKWQKAKDALEVAKNNEMDIRKEIAAAVFLNPEEGVNKVELGGGFELKLQHKLDYKLLDNAQVEDALEKISKVDNRGSFIAERLVTWKPSLSLTEYRDLEPKYKKLIDVALEITEAAPSLEIKEPKKKK